MSRCIHCDKKLEDLVNNEECLNCYESRVEAQYQ